MKHFKSAQQNVKKLIPSFRSHSPAGSDYQLDRQADRSSTPTHTLHASTSDNSASQSKSVTPTTLIVTQTGTPDIKDDKKPALRNTIVVEECPTALAPISAPSKKFMDVKTTNAQYDLVVLYVA